MQWGHVWCFELCQCLALHFHRFISRHIKDKSLSLPFSLVQTPFVLRRRSGSIQGRFLVHLSNLPLLFCHVLLLWLCFYCKIREHEESGLKLTTTGSSNHSHTLCRCTLMTDFNPSHEKFKRRALLFIVASLSAFDLPWFLLCSPCFVFFSVCPLSTTDLCPLFGGEFSKAAPHTLCLSVV